jgi:site-specific recombinase XerD
MKRLRVKVGLSPDENGETVVAYTLRHTGGTRATVNGVHSKVLATLMGHTSAATTERYQHPQFDHLHEAIQRANQRKAQ